MLDINFYMKVDEIIKRIEEKKITGQEEVADELEKIRGSGYL